MIIHYGGGLTLVDKGEYSILLIVLLAGQMGIYGPITS
jgi:hypothetical protein